MRKMEYQGTLYDAEVVDYITTTPEQYSVHKLDDGTIVKVKCVVREMIKLLNCYSPDGEPVYYVMTQQVISSRALPENIQNASPVVLQ